MSLFDNVKVRRVIDLIREKYPDGFWYYDPRSRLWLDLSVSGKRYVAHVCRLEDDGDIGSPSEYYLYTEGKCPERLYFG